MKKYAFLLLSFALCLQFGCENLQGEPHVNASFATPDSTKAAAADTSKNATVATTVTLDTADYNQRFAALVAEDKSGKWTNLKTPLPKPGAILPFKRVVAYYGNFYSTRMGILGEFPEDEVLQKLKADVEKWEKADTTTPVQPAIHYICVTAQQSGGKGGKYRLRMPFEQIEKAIALAKKADAIVFLDIQVGKSTLQEELPRLDTFLKMPHVHLAIDPEFSMKTGHNPGKKVGTFDATDVNWAAKYLAGLVNLFDLPPKMLVVHRYTRKMLTNYQNIKPLPEVQIVVHMDGWGGRAKKKTTYRQFIYPEPVQFTGFKIFYKNDTKKVGAETVMQPEEMLKLVPKPIYIQYQ